MKTKYSGSLCQQLVVAFGELAFAAELLLGVDLALHDVEFAVDLGQSAFGLDQDHAVHAVGDVLRSHRHGAMVDVKPGIDGGEFEAARFAGRRIGRLGTAAGTSHGVEVDVVHQDAVVMVFQTHFDRIADAHANERPGDLLIERPIAIGRAVGEIACHFNGLEIDPDALWPAAANRRRQVGRIAHDRNGAVGLYDLADLVCRQHRSIGRLSMVRLARLFRRRGAVAEQLRRRGELRKLWIEQCRCKDDGDGKSCQYGPHADHHAIISVFQEFHGCCPFHLRAFSNAS